MKKGMILDVFRHGDRDCTNDGITSRHDQVLLVGENIPEIFEAPELPRVIVCNRGDYIYARPDDDHEFGYMMGGNFIATTDSRIRRISKYPIPVHDRREDKEINGKSKFTVVMRCKREQPMVEHVYALSPKGAIEEACLKFTDTDAVTSGDIEIFAVFCGFQKNSSM